MHPYLEALGYLAIVSLFAGIPVLLFLYGLGVYLLHGIDEPTRMARTEPFDFTQIQDMKSESAGAIEELRKAG